MEGGRSLQADVSSAEEHHTPVRKGMVEELFQQLSRGLADFMPKLHPESEPPHPPRSFSVKMEGGQSSQELHTLVKKGDKVEVGELLRQARGGPHFKQMVECKLINGMTPLHVAALEGNAEIVELLIKIGHANIHARSLEGYTPLHLAVKHEHEAVVETFLKQNVSAIMAEDKRGDIPLHGAAQLGNRKIVELILSRAPDRQACMQAKNGELQTPLHYAAGSGKGEIVELLLGIERQNLKEARDGSGAIPFHFAARSGDVESLKKLVPSNINYKSKDGFTALHYAAWNANVEAVKWLIEKGASAKQKSVGGDTILHLAALSKKPGSDKVAEIIVTKEPESWKIENNERKLPIEIADEWNHGHVVRAILQSLRSLRALHDDLLTLRHKPNHATLLHYAAGHGTTEEVEWVMQKEKNMIESLDASSRTPLHWAAMKGNTSSLRPLANAGANLIEVSSKSETPLFLALSKRNIEFAEELLKCDIERFKNAESEEKCLTTEDWMRGVEEWMKVYYDSEVEEPVRKELCSNFKRHTDRKQSAVGNMFQEIPPLYLALHANRLDMAKFFQRLSSYMNAVNKKGPSTGRTALHWAVLLQKQVIVRQLCSEPEFRDTIRIFEEDAFGMAPVQYATELNLQNIEAELFKHGSMRDYIDGLYRDRQIYVDSTNAILVCAALIASVTFAGWLQPPLNYIDYAGLGHYAAIKPKGMRVFWVLNSLSFFAAIATVQAGACGVLLRRHVHIGREVIYIRRALMIASLLMALSVVCVLGAFGAAGFVVLPPILKYDIYMIVTVTFGGITNMVLLLWFIYRVLIGLQVWKMWRNVPGALIHRNSAPPHRTPADGESPPFSYTEPKMPVFRWDDGIEELYSRKP